MPNLKAVAEINKASNLTEELLAQLEPDGIPADTLREVLLHLGLARNILINEVVQSWLVLFHTGAQVTQFRHVETQEEAERLSTSWDARGPDYRSTLLSIKSHGNAQIGW